MTGVDPDRPVPVVVLADEHEATRQADAARRRRENVGLATLSVLFAPIVGLLARGVFEWGRLGWDLFGLV